MWTPPDAKEVTEHWEQHDERGACGPCAAAAVMGLPVSAVMEGWVTVNGEPYDGEGNRRKLRAVIEHLGFDTLAQPGKRYDYSWPELAGGQSAIVLVRWRPKDEWRHWMDDPSHWIGLAMRANGPWIYCNSWNYWAPRGAVNDIGYLNGAHVSSYLLIIPRNGVAGTGGGSSAA